MNHKLLEILEQLKPKNILVIGDIILDKYLLCSVDRISQEAPVPVAWVKDEENILGGAANVANNLKELGMSIELIGQIGQDRSARKISQLLKEKDIKADKIISTQDFTTIKKLRVVSQKQQLIRLDYEKNEDLKPELEEKILEYLEESFPSYDLIIISDYAKGFITKNLAQTLIRAANDSAKIIIADPKPSHMDYYKNVSLITPNTIEAEAIVGIKAESAEAAEEIVKALNRELNCDVVLTRGAQGMLILESRKIYSVPPKSKKQVYDVTGAGDTVLATIAACLANGIGLKQSCELASIAADVVIEKFGTATVNIDEIKNYFQL
jgi:rfaE bifunctional protein kinase chain/domain